MIEFLCDTGGGVLVLLLAFAASAGLFVWLLVRSSGETCDCPTHIVRRQDSDDGYAVVVTHVEGCPLKTGEDHGR